MISIIIRTKNEERWIPQCLKAVFSQEIDEPFEVILVDNMSTDSTVQKATAFDIKLVKIEKFLPGEAINIGIRASSGDKLVCISGHCIPTSVHWLKNLVKDLDNPNVAGVYGRQEPLSYTSDADKRDLINLFKLDRHVQKVDPFFHNANSAFRRDVWETIPFDEKVTNIEDRVWGKEVISRGMEIVYEPSASVYHHHGVHHGGDKRRCQKIVRILESLTQNSADTEEGMEFSKDISAMETVAVIPALGMERSCNDRNLIDYTIKRVKESELLSDVFISTNSPELIKIAEDNNIKTILRPEDLLGSHISLGDILNHSLSEMENQNIFPDAVMCLTENYPFRKKGFIDYLISQFFSQGFDTLLSVAQEDRSAWLGGEEGIQMISRLMPRELKSKHFYVSLLGLGCITRPNFIRQKEVFGENLGIQKIKDAFSKLEIRDESTLMLANEVADKFFQMDPIWESSKAEITSYEYL
jgi:CMP-N-acetylneuraminic acid synthetase